MADREAHLVGSLPGSTPSAAMSFALETLGPYLRTLPDGETGERRNWVILALPRDVRFAAGFAHESQSLADQLAIRSIIEDHLDRTVIISAACGMGRRSEDDGRRVLERTAELCTT